MTAVGTSENLSESQSLSRWRLWPQPHSVLVITSVRPVKYHHLVLLGRALNVNQFTLSPCDSVKCSELLERANMNLRRAAIQPADVDRRDAALPEEAPVEEEASTFTAH